MIIFSICDSLTDTAKYSSCQPNFVSANLLSLIQCDDSPFNNCSALLIDWSADSDISACTCSGSQLISFIKTAFSFALI